jgi:hypothetical protein
MLSVSVRQFRFVCAFGLATLLLAQLPALGLITFSEAVSNARAWRYFEATAPGWLILVYAIVVWAMLLIGLVTMLNFWRYSRWYLLIAVLGALPMRPFLGLSVYSPYEAILASLFAISTVWLVTISFWSPLANRFERPKGGPVVS